MMSQISQVLPMTDIEHPHDHDVLCGRGGLIYKHVGNYTFRYLVLFNKNAYCSSRKADKIKIARSLVKAIRGQDPPGRFLKQDPDSGLWHDIGDKRAIEKTSQALREGQRNIIQNNIARNNSAEHSESEKPSSAASHVTLDNNDSVLSANNMLMPCNDDNNPNNPNRLLFSGIGCQQMNASLCSQPLSQLAKAVNAGASSGQFMNTSTMSDSLPHTNTIKPFDEDELNQMICQTFLKDKAHLLHQNIPRLPSMTQVWNSSSNNKEGHTINQNNHEKRHNYFQGVDTSEMEGINNGDDSAKLKRIRFANMLESPQPKEPEQNNNPFPFKPAFQNTSTQGVNNLPVQRPTKPNWYAGRMA